jgi:hypothetical protein
LGLLSENEQYKLGLAAGKQLQQMHTLSAPAEIEDWELRCGKKYRQKDR